MALSLCFFCLLSAASRLTRRHMTQADTQTATASDSLHRIVFIKFFSSLSTYQRLKAKRNSGHLPLLAESNFRRADVQWRLLRSASFFHLFLFIAYPVPMLATLPKGGGVSGPVSE